MGEWRNLGSYWGFEGGIALLGFSRRILGFMMVQSHLDEIPMVFFFLVEIDFWVFLR